MISNCFKFLVKIFTEIQRLIARKCITQTFFYRILIQGIFVQNSTYYDSCIDSCMN